MSIQPKIFKQVRKALGLTQQELADALGLSRVTVNKMENGQLRRGIPDEIAARLLNLKNHAKPTPAKEVAKSIEFLQDDQEYWENEEDES